LARPYFFIFGGNMGNMMRYLVPAIIAIVAFILAHKFVKSSIIVQIIIAIVFYFVIWWLLGMIR